MPSISMKILLKVFALIVVLSGSIFGFTVFKVRVQGSWPPELRGICDMYVIPFLLLIIGVMAALFFVRMLTDELRK